jgi:hypothetical protein
MRRRALAASIIIIGALGSARAGDPPAATVEEAVARLSSALAAGDTEALSRVFLKVYATEYRETCDEGARVSAAKQRFTTAMNARFPPPREEELPGEDARSLAAELRACTGVKIVGKASMGEKEGLMLQVFRAADVLQMEWVAAREDGGWKLAPEGHDVPPLIANYAALKLAFTAALYDRLAAQVAAGRFKLRDDALAAAGAGCKELAAIPAADLITFKDHPETLELRWLLGDLLAAARAGDDARLAAAAEELALADPAAWLARTFGAGAPEPAVKACEREQRALAKDLAALARAGLDKGWTLVRVARVDSLPRMKVAVPLYSVRVAPLEESVEGRSLCWFARVDGAWRYVGKLESLAR